LFQPFTHTVNNITIIIITSITIQEEEKKKKMALKIDPSYLIEWSDLEIISQVGAGAFAEVHEALRAGERVAVKKMLTQTLDEKNLKEFQDEVVLMASFHSSFIVGLYGACFKPPNLCMAMEFLPGGNLNNLLYDKSQEISWEKRWRFACDAAVGMNYLHSRNPPVLHRDLKSGNLLLSEDGKVKITDFGLSRELTSKGGIQEETFQGGTDRWTAPEICNGEAYTEASDVFSFGIILYEIAARVLPFPDSLPEEVRKLWQASKRPTIPDDVPPDFERLIKMCWEQSPYSRPSFKEIVSYLRRKGKINLVSTGRTQERLSDEKEKLERENYVLAQLKDNLEKKRDEADRIAEREKKRAAELEEKFDELERRFNEEKLKRTQLDKETADLSRLLKKEEQRFKDLEDAKKSTEKNLKKNLKKTVDETSSENQRLLEESEKKLADEKARYIRLKSQVEDLEAQGQGEEQRRMELDRKIQLLQKEIEEEKKKREESERLRDAAEKKVKTEKRKAETEKKRREELEAEIEEEEKRRAAARRRG
jgi:serine/threonine protein kinase